MEHERKGTPETAASGQYDFEPVQPYLDSEGASTIVGHISTLFNQLHEETAHLLDGGLQDPSHTNAKARCDEFLAYLSEFTRHRKRGQECPDLIARIMLGSVIEYSLQLFLLSFEEDYRSTLSEK